jgi:DNA-binding beta-propeller fold protein YncE
MIHHRKEAKSRRWSKQATVAVGVGLFLALVGSLTQAQTSPEPTLVGPVRLSESPMGLLVGDYVGFSVVILNPETLAVSDTVPVTSKPLSVAWGNDRIYVGDEKTGFIEVYEKVRVKNTNTKVSGEKKKKYEWVQVSANLTSSPLPQPSDIAVDENSGLLFIASKINKMVSVFDPSGTLLRTIGGPDSDAPLERPQGLTLDRAGQRIFVSDDSVDMCSGWFSCALGAVVVYDYDGNLLGAIVSDDQPDEFKFGRAQGLTLDLAGRIYLVDSFRSEVLVFEETATNSWTAIGRIGTKGAGAKQLLLPMDVMVDALSSKIYVTSTMTARIEVFTMGDMVP